MEEIYKVFEDILKKYRQLDIEKEKEESHNKRVLDEVVKIGNEIMANHLGGKAGDIALEKGAKIPDKLLSIFAKYTKAGLKGFSPINKTQEIINYILRIVNAGRKEVPINTAFEGMEFYSEDTWNDFFNDIKKIQKKELENLSPAEFENKKKGFDRINAIMDLEYDRYDNIFNSLAEYYSTQEVSLERILTESTSAHIQKYSNIKEITNDDYDQLRNIISGNFQQVNSAWLSIPGKLKKHFDIIEPYWEELSKYYSFPLDQMEIVADTIQKNTTSNFSNNKMSSPKEHLEEKYKYPTPYIEPLQASLPTIGPIQAEGLNSANLNSLLYDDGTGELIKKLKDSFAELKKIKELIDYLNGNDKDSKRESLADKLGVTEEGLKKIEESPEALKTLNEAYEKLNETTAKKGTDNFFKNISDNIEKIGKGGFDNVADGLIGIGQTVKASEKDLNKFGEDLGSLFGKEDAKNIKNTISAFYAVVETGAGVGKVLKGDPTGIFDIASGLGKIFGNSKKVNEEHEKAIKLLEQNRKQQEHLYKLEQLRADLAFKKGTTVFGTDSWGKAKNAAGTYQDAINNLNESLKGDGKVKPKGLSGLFGLFGGIQQSDYAALENIDIVNGSKKSGWGPWKKRKDVYEGILSVYPDLISSEGKFNATLAQTIVNTRQMSDANKASLQQMIDNANEVEKIYGEMKNYLTGIFGSLGDQITDTFVDSFRNGTDAMDNFSKSAGAMLENIIKDMVYSIAIAPIIEEASKKMEAVMQDTNLSDEDRMNSYIGIIGTLIGDVAEQQSFVDELLGSTQDSAKEYGINIFEADPRQGLTGQGVTAMSQDSANELNGNFTALLQQTAFIRDLNNQSLLVQRTMESHLNRVADNTEYCRYLENVKNSLEEIQLRGVKIKA